MLILVGVLFLVPLLGEQLGVDLSFVSHAVGVVSGAIMAAILRLTGNG